MLAQSFMPGPKSIPSGIGSVTLCWRAMKMEAIGDVAYKKIIKHYFM